MAQHAHAHDAAEEYAEGGHDTHHGNYVRIWAILCVLLVVSVAGPFFGHPLVTLVTAFGIAVVKAYMVAKHFMHITVAPRFVAYLVGTCLAFMLLFFAGTAPDVMRLYGTNWKKPSLIQADAAYESEHHEAAH